MTTLSVEALKTKILELGWDDIGITSPSIPEDDIAAYRSWIGQGHHADLKYMENQMRCDPNTWLPGAKTAVILVSYYKQPRHDFSPDAGLVASYARGRKYHNVHHRRLKKLLQWMEETTGQKNIARGFSDSAPVLEKALAVKAGLGWFGKNTLLIHRRFGTFTLLSGFFTTLELPHQHAPRLPRCGSCTKCIDACPTAALETPYTLNARKCLSYHLIESQKSLPKEIQKKNPGYIFGCDICQDVCPHNQRTPLSDSADFSEMRGLGAFLPIERLEALESKPEDLYGTPLQRQGIKRLKETAQSLIKPKYTSSHKSGLQHLPDLE